MKYLHILFSLILVSPLEVAACRCVDPNLKNAYAMADAVALVRVTGIATDHEGITRAEGKVLSAWKAPLSPKLEVYTGDDCAYPFKANTTYLLYLQHDEDGRFGTYICRGNRINEKAGANLKWLRRYGRVTGEGP